jgi:hypothetical protein
MQLSDLNNMTRIVRSVAASILLLAVLAIGWLLTTGRHSQQTYAAPPPPTPIQQTIVFNRDIRPILADRCFSCHGPDPNKRQAGLRLDRPDAALGALPHHPKLKAFVPGDPDHSEALKRILSTDPVTVMPPATSHGSSRASRIRNTGRL